MTWFSPNWERRINPTPQITSWEIIQFNSISIPIQFTSHDPQWCSVSRIQVRNWPQATSATTQYQNTGWAPTDWWDSDCGCRGSCLILYMYLVTTDNSRYIIKNGFETFFHTGRRRRRWGRSIWGCSSCHPSCHWTQADSPTREKTPSVLRSSAL